MNAQPNSTWNSGTRIGRYKLIRLLGRGGLGEVWLAEDTGLKREVAIKALSSAELSSNELESLRAEAKATANLSHQGVVSVFDVGVVDGRYFIVMEYVDGRNLAQLIRRGELSFKDSISISIQVTEALLYVHHRGIIHGDIKPANILVADSLLPSSEGQYIAKITDLGLARTFTNDAKLTIDGPTGGTPLYIAPEQMEGRAPTPKSDIYALGVTLYELFVGTTPFESKSMVSLVESKLHGDPPDPRRERSNFPASLGSVIAEMLSRDPKRRPDLPRLLDVLRELLTGDSINDQPTNADESARIPETKEPSVRITRLSDADHPSGFFNASVLNKTEFFSDESVRYTKVQETLKFYRDHLNEEYQNLLNQAKLTFRLWLLCVGLGFAGLLAGVIALLMGKITQGVMTAVGASLVYFIQKIFQQREDHYRALASSKNAHLEYGNQWLLVIQSIDAIQDPDERKRRQVDLAKALTQKLSPRATTDRAQPARKPSPSRKPAKGKK